MATKTVAGAAARRPANNPHDSAEGLPRLAVTAAATVGREGE